MSSISTLRIGSRINISSVFEDALTRQGYISNQSVTDLSISSPPTAARLHLVTVARICNSRRITDALQYEMKALHIVDSLSTHKFLLTYFESSLFATVLEDMMCAIQILEKCNNAIQVIKTNLDLNTLLARKFAVPQCIGGDKLDDVNPNRLDCLEYKLQKLEDDRMFMKDVLLGTYADLILHRGYLYMSEQLTIAQDRILYRESLIEEEDRNRMLRRDLYRQLRQKRNHIKSVLYDTNGIIEHLKTSVEDIGLYTKARSRYVGNWQMARTEQHQRSIHHKEATPLANILQFKQKTDQEHRVHTEVELLNNITINENLQKIEQWMNKYDKDMEGIDLKIQKKRNQFEDMKNKNAELENTIEEHAKLCNNWVTFKEQREEARLYREKMTSAAISIQAWWRGLLVRNQLGPYRVLKKPPAAGGKKKK